MFNLINKVKNKKGFTLVELLVVLAVLAIISAIAIPRFAGVQDSAKKKADEETINTVQKALELCIVSETGITLPSDATTIEIGKLTKGTKGFKVTGETPHISQNIIDKYIDAKTGDLKSYNSATFSLTSTGTITVVTNP